MTEKSKPVIRAEHMKIIKAKAAALAQVREKETAALEQLYQSIMDAYAAGLHRDSIGEAAGISVNRVKHIKVLMMKRSQNGPL